MNKSQLILASFISAIRDKKIIELSFYSKEDGRVLVRRCVPFDFGPSRRSKIKNDKFHFLDLNSDEGAHPLSLTPEQIFDINVLEETFNPTHYVSWDTSKSPWSVERDWGNVS
jgi:hypothetical protein